MIRLYLVLLLFVIGSDVFSQTEKELNKIDEFLSDSEKEVSKGFFDSLIHIYPKSDFVFGMKMIWMLSSEELEDVKKYSESVSSDFEVPIGSYINMALGIIEFIQDKRQEGLDYLKRSYELDSNKQNKRVRVELFYELYDSDPDTAYFFLSEAQEIDPNFFEAKLAKVYSLDASRDCDDVLEIFKTLELESLSSYNLSTLGYAQYYCGKTSLSKKSFELSLGLENNGEAHLGLGDIAFLQGDFKEANRRYLLAADFEEFNYVASLALADLLMFSKNYDQALQLLLDIKSRYNDQEVFTSLTNLYLKSKQFNKAETTNIESIKVFGVNYYNAGFELIIRALIEGDLESGYDNVIKEYKGKYGQRAYDWLLSTLKSFL